MTQWKKTPLSSKNYLVHKEPSAVPSSLYIPFFFPPLQFKQHEFEFMKRRERGRTRVVGPILFSVRWESAVEGLTPAQLFFPTYLFLTSFIP